MPDESLTVQGEAFLSDSSAETLANEGFACEQYIKFREGQTLKGVFLGAGGTQEFSDEKTGEVRERASWRFSHPTNPNIVAVIGGSAQLDARLSGVAVGTHVVIRHMGQRDIEGGKRRANQYEFWTKAAVGK